MNTLQQIEAAWFDCAASVIVSQVAHLPYEKFYAAAFWLLYVDYSMFGTPCFAINSESHLAATRGEELESFTRWSPPNWQFDVLPESIEIMAPYYDALSSSLIDQPETAWDAAIEEHAQALARVCRRLTEDARHRSGPFTQVKLPRDFVMGIFEEREGEPTFSRWVNASIDPKILSILPSPTWAPA